LSTSLTEKCVINKTKNELGYIFGDFSTEAYSLLQSILRIELFLIGKNYNREVYKIYSPNIRQTNFFKKVTSLKIAFVEFDILAVFIFKT
jgi:hypothetical protein